MNDDKISQILAHCSLEQLELITQKLQSLAEEKKQAKSRASRFPPTSNDLQSLADQQGLDLSRLMREISKR